MRRAAPMPAMPLHPRGIPMTLTSSLRDHVTGRVVLPGDPDYEDSRHVHNFMIDKNPTAIAYCASVRDVQAVVEHARMNGQALAVRGGAHSVPGYGTADEALVADLSEMSRVQVDPERRTARVGGGATW